MGYVDKKVALRYLANSEVLFNKIKTNFLTNNKDTVEKITECIVNNDIEELHRIIHSIKGISLNLGSMVLYEDSCLVVDKLKKEEVDLPLIERFIDTFKNVYFELSKM